MWQTSGWTGKRTTTKKTLRSWWIWLWPTADRSHSAMQMALKWSQLLQVSLWTVSTCIALSSRFWNTVHRPAQAWNIEFMYSWLCQSSSPLKFILSVLRHMLTHRRMRARIHTCMHTSTHAYTLKNTGTHRYTHMHSLTPVHMHAHTHACTHAHTYARTHAHTYTRTHRHTHTCTHARTHTHTHKGKRIDRAKYGYCLPISCFDCTVIIHTQFTDELQPTCTLASAYNLLVSHVLHFRTPTTQATTNRRDSRLSRHNNHRSQRSANCRYHTWWQPQGEHSRLWTGEEERAAQDCVPVPAPSQWIRGIYSLQHSTPATGERNSAAWIWICTASSSSSFFIFFWCIRL